MKLKIACVLCFALIATGCSGEKKSFTAGEDDLALAKSALLVDTHIDVPYRLFDAYQDVSVATDAGDFDWPRARRGGLDVAFMSIYVPADLQEQGGAKEHADVLIDMMEDLAATNPQKFVVVSSSEESRAGFGKGQVALALGMENGAAIEDDLQNLSYFFERGIRYITLTHSKANLICDSSYDENRPWQGLSPFGEQVVREMNRLGIMVDISHVSDEAFSDVLEITEVPVIASHSSARHFTPGFERNMSDEMIEMLAVNGGVIQINFGSAFLTREANAWSDAHSDKRKAQLEESGWDKNGTEIKDWSKKYRKRNQYPFASLSDVLDHIDHVVRLVGVAHVGIGSDFDGVGDSLPEGIKDVSQFPNLVAGLRQRGYSDSDIRQILGENLMRVWRKVEAHAKAAQET